MDMPEKNDYNLYKTVKISGRLTILLGILGILYSVILEFVPSTEMFYRLSLFLLRVLFGFLSIVVGILSFIVENIKKHKKAVSIISLVVTIITIIFFILLFIDLL